MVFRRSAAVDYYERLPLHSPRHGLPANYAIDSWPWLSRVSVLGAPVPCLLWALVWGKHAVCSMVSQQQHTRLSARTTYHSCRKCNIFFFINMNIKRLLYIGQSDTCTTKLANATRTALQAICCGSGCMYGFPRTSTVRQRAQNRRKVT